MMALRFVAAGTSLLAGGLVAGCGGGQDNGQTPNVPQMCGGTTLPADPESAAAALGRVDAQWIAMGRRDAKFDTIFGESSAEIWAAVDDLQAQAVTAAAEAQGIPVPASVGALP